MTRRGGWLSMETGGWHQVVPQSWLVEWRYVAVKVVGLSTASNHKEMVGMNCIGEARTETERPF